MITIYIPSWNANAEEFGTVKADVAERLLTERSFVVRSLPVECDNPNVGVECDTDEEYAAVSDLDL